MNLNAQMAKWQTKTSYEQNAKLSNILTSNCTNATMNESITNTTTASNCSRMRIK